MVRKNWYHVSSHGAVLFCIAARQACTIDDLAEAMSLTRRQVQGIVRDLRQAGMLHVQKQGRRYHFSVNLDAPFQHPALRGYTLRPILGELVGEASQS